MNSHASMRRDDEGNTKGRRRDDEGKGKETRICVASSGQDGGIFVRFLVPPFAVPLAITSIDT